MGDDGTEAKSVLMEESITFYCKSRNLRYNEESGWVELLAPLAALGLSKSLLFNSLYTLLAKFIPRYLSSVVQLIVLPNSVNHLLRDCRAGGKPFDLFRLLLLYHDPELCSVLDTRKLLPHLYLQPWVSPTQRAEYLSLSPASFSLYVCSCSV